MSDKRFPLRPLGESDSAGSHRELERSPAEPKKCCASTAEARLAYKEVDEMLRRGKEKREREVEVDVKVDVDVDVEAEEE